MSPTTLRLVLLVSCAHALVHVYELSLPSVEQLIGKDYGVSAEVTGWLGTVWRLPFGLGAVLAGWLADRFGSKPMLVIYLSGCAFTSLLAWLAPSLAVLFVVMFAMGSFASIYHPAGLALISREASPEYRPLALGYHGIFGSLGIAGAPLLAAIVLGVGLNWHQLFAVLVVPGAVMAIVIQRSLVEHHRAEDGKSGHHGPAKDIPRGWNSSADGAAREPFPILNYGLLITIGMMFGFVYAALMHFLPRYLDSAGLRPEGITAGAWRNLLTAGVLLVGCVGQYLAGRFARHDRLEGMLVGILVASTPAMFWMAYASGISQVFAAALFALVHFMHQPVYNSLIAQYVPSSRRSIGFGVSNLMTFGFGSLGAGYSGWMQSWQGQWATYAGLGVLTAAAAALGVVLLQVRSRAPT